MELEFFDDNWEIVRNPLEQTRRFLSQEYGVSYSTQRQECCGTSEGPGIRSWKYCLGNILSENIHLSVFFIDCSLEELAEIFCPLPW